MHRGFLSGQENSCSISAGSTGQSSLWRTLFNARFLLRCLRVEKHPSFSCPALSTRVFKFPGTVRVSETPRRGSGTLRPLVKDSLSEQVEQDQPLPRARRGAVPFILSR